MKKIIVWLAVMMYTLSGYAQNAPWNFQSKVVTDTLFSKVLNSKRAYTVFLPKSFEQNKEKNIRSYIFAWYVGDQSCLGRAWTCKRCDGSPCSQWRSM